MDLGDPNPNTHEGQSLASDFTALLQQMDGWILLDGNGLIEVIKIM